MQALRFTSVGRAERLRERGEEVVEEEAVVELREGGLALLG
jgi:hypothetical protein